MSGIADAIYTDFATEPPRLRADPNVPGDLWLLMDDEQEYSGDCQDLAQLMEKAVRILGGTASVGYIYGSTDTDCYSAYSDDREERTCPGGEHGAEEIWVYCPGFGGWNSYEAVCVVGNKYYAIQMTSNPSAVEILRYWVTEDTNNNHQAWRYLEDYTLYICEDPGPYPVPEP